MADQTKIDILIETANSAKNVRELKKALMDLKSAQQDVDKSSPEFDKLIGGINETEGRIGDLNDAFKTFAGSGMERLTSSTYLLKDGFNNLDLDKLKIAFGGLSQLPKTLAGELNKLTAIVGKLNFASLGEGMNKLSKTGVGELTKSIVQLGKAILTNPILLLAAVIIGLIAVVVKFYDKIIPLRIAIEAIGAVVDVVVQSLKDFADWLGITDFAGEEKATNTLANAQKEQAAIEKRYDREIAVAQAAGKDTVELEKKKEVAVRKSIQMQIEQLNKLKQITGKLTEDQIKQLDDLKVAYEDSLNKTAVIDAKAKKDQEDRDAKELEERKKKYADAAKAKSDANKKADQEIADLRVSLINEEEIREKEQVRLNYERKRKEVKASKADTEKIKEETKLLEEKYRMDIAAINDKWNAKDLTRQKEIADAFWKLKEVQLKQASNGQFMTADELRKKLEASDGEYMKSYEAGLKIKNDAFDKAGADLALFNKTHTQKLTKDELEQQQRLKDAIVQSNYDKIAYVNEYELQKEAIIKTFRDKDIENEIAMYEKSIVNMEGFSRSEKENLDTRYKAIGVADKALVDAKISVLELQKAKELDNADLTGTQKQVIMNKYAQDEYKLKAQLIDDLAKKEAEAQAKKLNLWAQYVDMVSGALNAVGSIAMQALQQEGDAFNATKQREMDDTAYATDVQIQNIDDAAKAGTISSEEAAAKKKALQDQEAQNEYKTKLELYNFNKALKHKEFVRNKAFQLGEAVMNTASGIMKSLASAPLAYGPVPNPIGIASMIAVAVAGAANIAKILATQEGDAGAPPKPPILSAAGVSGGGGSNAGGSGGSSNFMAPQFFRLGQGQGSPMNKPQRVYVLESDITDAQKRVDKVVIRNTQELGP